MSALTVIAAHQLNELRRQADVDGDADLSALCARALSGNHDARAACAEALDDAEADRSPSDAWQTWVGDDSPWWYTAQELEAYCDACPFGWVPASTRVLLRRYHERATRIEVELAHADGPRVVAARTTDPDDVVAALPPGWVVALDGWRRAVERPDGRQEVPIAPAFEGAPVELGDWFYMPGTEDAPSRLACVQKIMAPDGAPALLLHLSSPDAPDECVGTLWARPAELASCELCGTLEAALEAAG